MEKAFEGGVPEISWREATLKQTERYHVRVRRRVGSGVDLQTVGAD